MTATETTLTISAIRTSIHSAILSAARKHAPAGHAAAKRAEAAIGIAALADLYEEQGDLYAAESVRAGHWQETAEGARVVTVGRFGANVAGTGNGHSVSVWTTKVYRAERRSRDGVLTWRLVSQLRSHSTAGREISGPMVARAKAEAADRGLPYVSSVTHGEMCQ